ncbi:molybdopterin molybdotransferase MoeA [Pelagibacterium lentulum]|nr:gephyrin-like molybdotransferase Glp [Pelagibacterium lentulum]
MMLLPVDEAIATIVEASAALPSETIDLHHASGRTLAAPVVAKLDNPPFPASAMDGYAVRAADVTEGAVLKQIGEVSAGALPIGLTVAPGTCVRIFTGAAVPDGADAVIMQEDTEASAAGILFKTSAAAGRNIRKKGNDFQAGDVLLQTGTALGPAQMALVAAGNNAQVIVCRRPHVALLATGDELLPVGSAPAPGQIISSNTTGLSAVFGGACNVTDFGIAPDDRAVLGSILQTMLAREPNVIVTTGGASVGEHDFVQEMLIANGVEIGFWRLAMRPGKPLMFGRKGNTLVFGLPGNPVSALVTAQVFVLPAIRAMLGQEQTTPLTIPLGADLPENGSRRHYVRARLQRGSDGQTCAVPIGETDSGHLSSLAQSDCLIIQPENAPAMGAGTLVDVLPL